MLRQRRLRSQADPVWTTASASMPGHTPQARARGASVRENRWRAAMLAGFSLVLHGALTAFAMFLVVPSLPVGDIPLAMELAFEAPASPTGSAMPENAANGLAGPAEAEQPRPAPAVSKAAPEQPVPDVPPSAAQPFSPKPDVPLPASAVTPEPVPSSPVQTSQHVPEQPRPAAPLVAATSLKPPMPCTGQRQGLCRYSASFHRSGRLRQRLPSNRGFRLHPRRRASKTHPRLRRYFRRPP